MYCDTREPIVAVPARNEANRLPDLLKALESQSWLTDAHAPLRVVLVFNNCSDASVAVAHSIQRSTPSLALDIVDVHFEPLKSHIGSARRLAMDRAANAIDSRTVLLTTDADAVPKSNWIEANLRAIANGADLVGGHIVVDGMQEALLGAGFMRRANRHRHFVRLVNHLAALIHPDVDDPWPRHSDHTGASLAVKSEVYTQIGGIPQVPCREDIAFVAQARRAGFRLRHPLDVEVQVSSRLDGRATGGMADCLKAWVVAEGRRLPQLVDDPVTMMGRLSDRQIPGAALATGGSNDLHRVKTGKVEIEAAIQVLEHTLAPQK